MLYTILPGLFQSPKFIRFFSPNRIKYFLKENFRINTQAYIYELEIPDMYLTTNIGNQQNNKIFRVNDINKQYFQCLNYSEKYIHDINNQIPYALHYPCSRLLINNFIGVDATEYKIEDKYENLNREGIIWDLKSINVKLDLIDYKRSTDVK